MPLVRDQVEDLRALGYPEGDQDALEAMWDDTEAILDEVDSDPEAALAREDDPFVEVNVRLDDYGLTSCGSGAG